MTGFLDRLLHADKPQPLDVDTAAAMLSTTPGLLREFERSYHANVLDRKNAPTGPLGPDAKTVVESRSGHGLSDEALALDARIVRELLSDTGVIRFDGERLTTIPALAPVPEKYVTESDVNALQTGERPQLAGELIHRQIDAVNYPLLLDMWRRATDPKRSARQRHEAYGMFRMGRELINGTDRWCLWLRDAEPGELRKSSFLKKRVDACAEYRRNAPMKGDAYKHRATPWLFRDDHQPSTNYLAIPKVFSEDREYMTCDWYTPDIIAGDMVYTSPDRDGLAFAVIESRMFMTWQQTIGGRLESRCRFSNTVVWNNLPLPALDDETRTALIEAGRNVLVARANHPGQSLADLYDPDYMPTDLRAAHRELDKVADVAFGARKWLKDDDDARLQVLFKSYTHMTGSSEV